MTCSILNYILCDSIYLFFHRRTQIPCNILHDNGKCDKYPLFDTAVSNNNDEKYSYENQIIFSRHLTPKIYIFTINVNFINVNYITYH